jgi:hypothetical protein
MFWALLCGICWADEDPLALARQELAALVAETQDETLRDVLTSIDAHLATVQGQVVTLRTADGTMVTVTTTPVSVAPQEPPASEPAATGSTTPACSDLEYETLKDHVASENFSREKIDVLMRASARLHFTVEQVIGLLDLLDFGTDKVQAAALLHPRLVDPGAFDQVYESFVFETDRDALRALVED